jgi:hypothetical protein
MRDHSSGNPYGKAHGALRVLSVPSGGNAISLLCFHGPSSSTALIDLPFAPWRSEKFG